MNAFILKPRFDEALHLYIRPDTKGASILIIATPTCWKKCRLK